MEAYKVDSIMDSLEDVMTNLIKMMYEKDEEKKKKIVEGFLSGFYP